MRGYLYVPVPVPPPLPCVRVHKFEMAAHGAYDKCKPQPNLLRKTEKEKQTQWQIYRVTKYKEKAGQKYIQCLSKYLNY